MNQASQNNSFFFFGFFLGGKRLALVKLKIKNKS